MATDRIETQAVESNTFEAQAQNPSDFQYLTKADLDELKVAEQLLDELACRYSRRYNKFQSQWISFPDQGKAILNAIRNIEACHWTFDKALRNLKEAYLLADSVVKLTLLAEDLNDYEQETDNPAMPE